jgi:serine protease Do
MQGFDSYPGTPRRPRRVGRAGVAIGALVLAGSAAAWTAARSPEHAASAVAAAEPVVMAAEPLPGGHLVQDSYADVVDRVAPAVVTIRSERRVRVSQQQQFPFMQDPFFRDFFGDRAPRQAPAPRREGGLGSGVIVKSDGYILTNHHVVDGGQDITVELTDGRSFKAKLVGSDPPSDLALLKIEGQNLKTLPLGDSDRLRVGDVVLALGNPLGVGQTVTMGIVSAKGRSTGPGDGSFEDFIQTDAPINHGNSGGALVNTRGELVGINSQILSPSGGNIGIGFAVPASMARDVMGQLMNGGRVTRGMLGVTVQGITADLASSLRLPSVHGALVSDVTPGGPADHAGIRQRDVITAIDGAPVSDSNSLRNHVARVQPGHEVKVTVWRDGQERTLTARLSELPSQRRRADASDRDDDSPDTAAPTGALGLRVEPLTAQAASQLGVRGAQGLVVVDVDPDGPAADAGIREQDVIREVNGSPVRSAADLRQALRPSGGRPALVLVNRGGSNLYLTVTAPAA